MPAVFIALIVLGFILLNVMLAYVPIVLIVGHTLRSKQLPKDQDSEVLLLERWQNDEISTEEYLKEIDQLWKGRTHAPL